MRISATSAAYERLTTKMRVLPWLSLQHDNGRIFGPNVQYIYKISRGTGFLRLSTTSASYERLINKMCVCAC